MTVKVTAAYNLTLADLLDQVQDDPDLEPTRRRDVISSLRSFARCVGRELGALPIQGELLRSLIRRTSPAGAKISVKRWANICSDLGFALKRYGGTQPRQWQAGHHLAGPWRELRDRIPDPWERIRLCRLFRFLKERAIAPAEVTSQTFDDFEAYLRNETLARNPDGLLRLINRYWNRATTTVPGWPQVKAPDVARTDLYALPLAAFPATFEVDLSAWRAAMSGDDLFAERAPHRAMRPRTIQHELKIFQRFASALVHQGLAPGALTSLAELVRPDRFKLGLRYFLDRNAGKPTPGLNQMADILIVLARRWVQIEPAALAELKRIAGCIDCRQPGLTPTNRTRLAQFDDPHNIARLLDLPSNLVQAVGQNIADTTTSLVVQTALAISILLAAPLRLHNLAQLNLHRHVVRNGGNVRLVIERQETKNREVLDYPLPAETMQILDLYQRRYRPLLRNGNDQGWLFPGRHGSAKAEGLLSQQIQLLSQQIQKAVLRHTGLVMHVHLFRHLAGKLSLLADPGNYEQVRRLLGHRSMVTTTTFYTGFATDAAARRYHQQVLDRPEARKAVCRRGPKTRSLGWA